MRALVRTKISLYSANTLSIYAVYSDHTSVYYVPCSSYHLSVPYQYRISTVSVRYQYGISMVSVWYQYSISTVLVLYQYSISTVSVQYQYGISTASVLYQYFHLITYSM